MIYYVYKVSYSLRLWSESNTPAVKICIRKHHIRRKRLVLVTERKSTLTNAKMGYWLSLCGLAVLGMLLHGVAARIRLETILTSESSFQVAADYVPPNGASLHLSTATLPEAHKLVLVVSLYAVRVAKMHAKFAPVIQNGMTAPFTILSPRAFKKSRLFLRRNYDR